jgi:transcriptional regulator of acetoin/glycerol metabolism
MRVELESLIGFLVGVVDFQDTDELTVSRTGTAANVAADGEERAVRQVEVVATLSPKHQTIRQRLVRRPRERHLLCNLPGCQNTHRSRVGVVGAHSNRSAATRLLGIGRRTLYAKMDKLGINATWRVS